MIPAFTAFATELRRFTPVAVPARRAALRATAVAWWRDRTVRERWLLAAFAAIAIVAALDRLAWRPLAAMRDAAQAERVHQACLAAQLHAAGPEIARLAAARRGPLAALVTAHASQAGLAITRLDPQGTSVAVTFDSVEFDRLAGWLAALDRDAGVVATELKVERRVDPGLVGAQVTLAAR